MKSGFFRPRPRDDGDVKPRRHVLLTGCRPSDDLAMLAYASTRSRDALLGGACVRIDSAATRYATAGLTGFSRLTYVYPCRLISTDPRAMIRFGRAAD